MADKITKILQKFALSSKDMNETEIDLGDVGPSVKIVGKGW